MNGSRTSAPAGDSKTPRSMRTRRVVRVLPFPSPRPSPLGEGETFARALVIRPSLVDVRLRNERQRGGDWHCNVRIFQRRAGALPLLGERVGVRGNETNSNPPQACEGFRDCKLLEAWYIRQVLEISHGNI